MSAMGTDVLAAACILGGAALSGGATFAAMHQSGQADCSVQAIATPSVTVRMGSRGHDVVVGARSVRVLKGPGMHGCAAILVNDRVLVRTDEARARLADALRRADEARARAREVTGTVDAARVRAERARQQVEATATDQSPAQLREKLAQLQNELGRLDEKGNR